MNAKLKLMTGAVRLALFAPLPLEVDSLDSLDEAHRPLYIKDGDKFRLEVTGIEGLRSALEKERKEAKEARERARTIAEQYKDIDSVKYRELMKQIDEDEEMRLMASGQKETAFKKRTDRIEADHKKEMEKKEAELKKERDENTAYRSKVLDNEVRAAASKAGLHAHAIPDALYRAKAEGFVIDSTGGAVKLGTDGKPVTVKDGKSFTLDDWFGEMRDKAPHWFPVQSAGGGASGEGSSKGNGSGGPKKMLRSEFNALPTAKEKQVHALQVKKGELQIVDD